MTTPTETRPAPSWLRELAAARGQYEELFGWPVSVDVEPRRLVALVGGALDTVTMPGALGERVLTELQHEMSAGPVVADPNGDSWTFLTRPTGCCELPAELHQVGIRTGRPGACAVIPTSPAETSRHTWWWVERPRTGRALPPWSVVIDAVHAIVG